MHTFTAMIKYIICLLFCLLLVSGCDDKNDTPQITQIVSKRIEINKKQVLPQKQLVKKKDDSETIQQEPDPKALSPASAYNPKGKLDPFEPLFRAKSFETSIAKNKIKKRRPRTPLEKIALSQLKLTGIILKPSGNKAMVEEANGKGYVITKGTPIGKQCGKIVEILKDRIIVEEEVQNLLGESILKRSEIKIQRPLGEL